MTQPSLIKSNVAHNGFIVFNPHEVNITLVENIYVAKKPPVTSLELESKGVIEVKSDNINVFPVIIGKFTMSPANFKLLTQHMNKSLESMEDKYGEIAVEVFEGMR
jgi:hypothetical protein